MNKTKNIDDHVRKEVWDGPHAFGAKKKRLEMPFMMQYQADDALGPVRKKITVDLLLTLYLCMKQILDPDDV